MKILLLNPQIDAAHGIVEALRRQKVALLLPMNTEEAWQMLQIHGSSLDLAIIHREGANGQDEAGIGFLAKLKADPANADLAVILTSQQWNDTQFGVHQQSPNGANAYLRAPFTRDQLFSTIEAVFGERLFAVEEAPSMPPEPPFATASNAPPPPPGASQSDPGTSPELLLEDASAVFQQEATPPDSARGIFLEAPFEAPPTPPPPSESANIDLALDAPAAPDAPELPVEPPATSNSPQSIEAMLDAPATGAGIQLESLPAPDRPSQAPALTSVSVNPEAAADISVEAEEREIASELPYLFDHGSSGPKPGYNPALAFGQPLGDAVVPGGAAHSPDIETLKKYLLLREQDVAVLSSQLRSTQEQVRALDEMIKLERSRSTELDHVVKDQKRKIEDFDRSQAVMVESFQTEISELKFQIKSRTDKARLLEAQVRDATEEMERLKDRVRGDIRKIRVREKELENRLEILRKDSEALLAARENKIVELKRKLDLLEFNMDLLQDQHSREKQNAAKLREKLTKAAQMVRVAGGLLDSPGTGKHHGEEFSQQAESAGPRLPGLEEESDQSAENSSDRTKELKQQVS